MKGKRNVDDFEIECCRKVFSFSCEQENGGRGGEQKWSVYSRSLSCWPSICTCGALIYIYSNSPFMIMIMMETTLPWRPDTLLYLGIFHLLYCLPIHSPYLTHHPFILWCDGTQQKEDRRCTSYIHTPRRRKVLCGATTLYRCPEVDMRVNKGGQRI